MSCPECRAPLETKHEKCPYCGTVLMESALYLDPGDLDELIDEMEGHGEADDAADE